MSIEQTEDSIPTMTYDEAMKRMENSGEEVEFRDSANGKLTIISPPEYEEHEDTPIMGHLAGLRVPDDHEDPDAYPDQMPEILHHLHGGGSPEG